LKPNYEKNFIRHHICRQRKKQKAPQQSCCNNTVRFHSAAGQWDTQPSPIPSVLLFATWPMCVSVCVRVLSLGIEGLEASIWFQWLTRHPMDPQSKWPRETTLSKLVGEVSRPSALVSWCCTWDLIRLDRYHILKKMLNAVSAMNVEFTMTLIYELSSGIN